MTVSPSRGPDMHATSNRAPHANTPLRRIIATVLRQKLTIASTALILVYIFVALFADLLAPYDPHAQDLLQRNAGFTAEHPLGTDSLGRDTLSRAIHGARITLMAPVIAVGIGAGLGIPAGLVSGFFRGWVDWLLNRLADALFSVPSIILAMVVVAVRGPSTFNAMMAVGILFAPRIYRVVRASTLTVLNREYVFAARTQGLSSTTILAKHIAPNISGPLIVQLTVLLGLGVLVEGGLSFLGIGIQPPEASWGVLLRQAFDNLYSQPLGSVAPGLLITSLILAFQLIGDGLRDVLGSRRER